MNYTFSIIMDGKAIPDEKKNKVKSIEITTRLDGADECRLSIADVGFTFLETKYFLEDYPIKIFVKFFNYNLTYKFYGYISTIDIDFPEDGVPTLEIMCTDRTHLLSRQKKKRTWKKTSRMAVAQKIAAEYGLKFVGEKGYTSKVEDSIEQSDQTDLELLDSFAGAEREIMVCKVIDGTLYYIRKNPDSFYTYLKGGKGPKETPLHYREYDCSVKSFQPKITKETRQVDTESSNISAKDKKKDKATATDKKTKRYMNKGDKAVKTANGKGNNDSDSNSGASVKNIWSKSK